jgi:hypothetical protein
MLLLAAPFVKQAQRLAADANQNPWLAIMPCICTGGLQGRILLSAKKAAGSAASGGDASNACDNRLMLAQCAACTASLRHFMSPASALPEKITNCWLHAAACCPPQIGGMVIELRHGKQVQHAASSAGRGSLAP